MPAFRCRISTRNEPILEKTYRAESKDALARQLEQEGFFVLSIQNEKPPSGSFSLSSYKIGERIRDKDFFSFNQELSVLIKSGLSIVAVFDAIIEKDAGNPMNPVLMKVREDIIGGESLSGAFSKYKDVFSDLYVASIKAGEKSGDIPLTLARYIDHMKKVAELKNKVITSSVYPIILTIASVFVLFFLLIYVVPAISGTFYESNRELPAITTLLVLISSTLKAYVIYIALLLAVGSAFIINFLKTDGGRLLLDKIKLSLPYLGDLYTNYVTSKFTRTLATVLSGGITLVESVQIASEVLKNNYLKEKLDDVIDHIKEGEGFSKSLMLSGVFPMLAIRMIDAAESGGMLESVLNDVADFYDTNVETRLSVLTSLIEPVLMVFMGLLIGFIVLALYLPIFQLAGTIE